MIFISSKVIKTEVNRGSAYELHLQNLPPARLVHREKSNGSRDSRFAICGNGVMRIQLDNASRRNSDKSVISVTDPRHFHPSGVSSSSHSHTSSPSHVTFQGFPDLIADTELAFPTNECKHEGTVTRWKPEALFLLLIPFIGLCICLNLGIDHCKRCGKRLEK
ncbi:uncharacterized protein LOC136026040 isoform X1 [Artemia franciscana]|uniref:uncharacterized protein LOC136026040 isoform X1 n=1 Tax=Artemia franciscana TaxID=6661 RepID=UPI0032DB2AD2